MLSRATGKALLRLCGWRIDGEFPNVATCVAINAPHTSNWDFFFGVCAMFALGLRIEWMGKHTLFRPPFGWFMRLLGGTPIDRRQSEGVVEQIVETMKARDSFILGLAPEGTRKRVGRWKTGFYRVATQAGVPIVLTYFDYKRRTIGIGPTVEPTGDIEHEMAEIRHYYQERTARHPSQF
jgi:1-acyl-sn-glycerol-3-phosphate acyltransferase